MGKTHLTIKKRILEVQSIETKLTFPTTVREHSNALYLKLPSNCAEYYEIRAGDTVLVSILEVRRAKQEEA
jgi:hypothetical protein